MQIAASLESRINPSDCWLQVRRVGAVHCASQVLLSVRARKVALRLTYTQHCRWPPWQQLSCAMRSAECGADGAGLLGRWLRCATAFGEPRS